MRNEPGFKECSKDLQKWPWDLEKRITRDTLKVNHVV